VGKELVREQTKKAMTNHDAPVIKLIRFESRWEFPVGIPSAWACCVLCSFSALVYFISLLNRTLRLTSCPPSIELLASKLQARRLQSPLDL
jgi:hypothetical protein